MKRFFKNPRNKEAALKAAYWSAIIVGLYNEIRMWLPIGQL